MKRRLLLAVAVTLAALGLAAIPGTADASIAWRTSPAVLPPQPSPIHGQACIRIIWITVCTPYRGAVAS